MWGRGQWVCHASGTRGKDNVSVGLFYIFNVFVTHDSDRVESWISLNVLPITMCKRVWVLKVWLEHAIDWYHMMLVTCPGQLTHLPIRQSSAASHQGFQYTSQGICSARQTLFWRTWWLMWVVRSACHGAHTLISHTERDNISLLLSLHHWLLLPLATRDCPPSPVGCLYSQTLQVQTTNIFQAHRDY